MARTLYRRIKRTRNGRRTRRQRGGSAEHVAQELWPNYHKLSAVNVNLAFTTEEHPPIDLFVDRKLNPIRKAFTQLQQNPPKDVDHATKPLLQSLSILRDAILLIGKHFGYHRPMNVSVSSPLKHELHKVDQLISSIRSFRSAPYSFTEDRSFFQTIQDWIRPTPSHSRASPISLEEEMKVDELA